MPPGGGVKETNPLLKDLPKDTAKNWEIDIVECLEKLKVDLFEDDDDDEEGGDHPINFAQAAIGLYHSATVYARKIDSLYLKMYETMELLGRGVGEKERRKNAREAKKLRKKLGIFDDGDGCELLDNKIVRAPDSQLNMLKGGGQKGMNTNHSFVHRVPLFLVPREEGDRKRPEYKVSGCTVNPYNMAVLLPDLEGKCSTNMEEDIILRKHSGNDGTAADVAPLPPPPTQTLVEAPGMPSIDDEGEGEEEANASAAAALNDYPPHDDGDDGVSLPDQHDDDYNNDSGIGAEPAPVTGEENEGEAIHDAVLDASSTNSLPNGDLQPVNESNAIDVYEGEEDDDEDDEEEEGIWTLLDPYVNPGKKPHKPMKIGIVGKPITVKVQNAASIKLSNGRRAAMNLDIAEDSILPNTSDRPALVWQTMGEYPEAASIENKLALQVSNNRKESRKVVRQRNERASMERMKALQQLRATRNVVTEAERREEKPQHGIDEGGESSDSEDDDNNNDNRRSIAASIRSPGIMNSPPHIDDGPSRLSISSSNEYSAMLPVRRDVGPTSGFSTTAAGGASSDIAKEAQFREFFKRQEEYDKIIQKYLLKEFQSGNEPESFNSPGEARTGIDLLNRDLERNAQNIYAKVRKWQDQVEPLLEEQDNRPPFTLESYTKNVIEKVKTSNERIAGTQASRIRGPEGGYGDDDMDDDDEEEEDSPPPTTLDDILQGEPAWNVGRLFLSALILTNNGNMDIFDSGNSPGSTGADDDTHGADDGTVVPTADDINMSPGSSGDDGVKRKEGRKKKYGIRLLDADKCVNYDVEEGDDIDVGDNNIASRRGKKKPRRK